MIKAWIGTSLLVFIELMLAGLAMTWIDHYGTLTVLAGLTAGTAMILLTLKLANVYWIKE